MADDTATQWYWCLRHDTPETAEGCPAKYRMGPYPTPEAAERFAETAEARNEAWDEEDERWQGG